MIVIHEFLIFSERQLEVDSTIHSPTAAMHNGAVSYRSVKVYGQ